MRIVIPDDYQHAVDGLDCLAMVAGHSLTILGDLAREPDADRVLAEAEALVLIRERTRIDEAFLRRTPKLRCIGQTGKVARNIDLDACTARGIAVTEGDSSPVAPAELTWALILAARRRLVEAVAGLHQGRWQTTFGEVLAGRVLGIWGYGKIGRLIARYGRAFDMDVRIWGSDSSRAAATADGLAAFPAKEALFELSDVATIHIRLTPATRGSVRRDDLGRMKSTALFVNTSRADLVEGGALEAALAAGRPGYAAVDVYSSEPILDPDHPLLKLPNLLATPHLGYVERDSYELYFSSAFRNILDFAAGQPRNLANPAVLGAR